MISFEMEDLIGVLQGLKSYFIAMAILLILAIFITAAVKGREKKLKALIRKETWICAVAGILNSFQADELDSRNHRELFLFPASGKGKRHKQ